MSQVEGKRVLSENKGKKVMVAVVVVVALVLLLCGGYLGLCYYAGDGDKLMPNTTIDGVDVGGMTVAEAEDSVISHLASKLEGLSVDFSCDGELYTVEGTEFSVDPTALVAQASAEQEMSFYQRGYAYIYALMGGNSYSSSITLTQTPTALLEAEAAWTDEDTQSSWMLGMEILVMEKGVTGRSLDVESLETDLVERMQETIRTGIVDAQPIEAAVGLAPPVEPDFQAIYNEIYVAPVSACLDPETKELVSAAVGVRFDIDDARALFEAAEEGSTIEIPLIFDEPAILDEEFESNLFADLLGSTQTTCSGNSSRLYNIDLVCSFVDGTILLPGETFSYTELCGPYVASTGYVSAGSYVDGMTVDSMAGGICQLSSTLYWASLEANLEIVERTKHTYNTGYMPVLGTDATVYGDVLDFQFKNDTEYPIRIETWRNTSNSVLTVNIYGTNTTGLHGVVYHSTVSVAYPQTLYEAKADQPLGTTTADSERTAYTGYTVDVYRNQVDDDGNVVETEYLYRNTYKSRDKVIFYNPADAASLGIDTATGTIVTPTETVTPEETVVPEETVTPEEVVTPEVTVTPEEVVTPEVTATPEEVVTPEVTVTPEEVVTPEVTVTPEVSEAILPEE